jgi:hypothetical protein
VPAVANRLEVANHHPAATSFFQFRDWMSNLDAHEYDLMILQFAEAIEVSRDCFGSHDSDSLASRRSASASNCRNLGKRRSEVIISSLGLGRTTRISLSLFMVSRFCDWPSDCVYSRHESH